MQKILLESRSADTVVVVGRDVGRAGESLTVTTLAELDAACVDMKCLLIVGASTTQRTRSGQVWTPRFVERSRAGS
jgi:precorrin-2 C20-methyltransferase/precorrin-3B C17-methyltransferase